jgi:hypothetical protein
MLDQRVPARWTPQLTATEVGDPADFCARSRRFPRGAWLAGPRLCP